MSGSQEILSILSSISDLIKNMLLEEIIKIRTWGGEHKSVVINNWVLNEFSSLNWLQEFDVKTREMIFNIIKGEKKRITALQQKTNTKIKLYFGIDIQSNKSETNSSLQLRHRSCFCISFDHCVV